MTIYVIITFISILSLFRLSDALILTVSQLQTANDDVTN